MMMLTRLARSLLRTQRMYYSTMEKKNVIVVPKRYELTFVQFEALVSEIERSPTCKVLAALVKVLRLTLRATLSSSVINISQLYSIKSVGMIL